ncbi:hypothetical protein ACE7GA_15470 [Roseomonas sp. CCTCC AB2023176]|uniref:hypothetical protein n=1 Tax=Roseomonas sp. CCTCC AB2023176 TaxID=3342640 RepID=UPI0035D559B9
MRSSTRGSAPSTWPTSPDPAAWQALPDDLQLTLAQEAMRRAADTLADHAELLAAEMENGALLDQGRTGRAAPLRLRRQGDEQRRFRLRRERVTGRSVA